MPNATYDKAKLKAAFSQIEKQHGDGTIFRLGSSRRLKVDVISTGILGVDLASGIGGFARGRVLEIYGPESGGKTTLCLQTIGMAQAAGGLAAFIDAEHALDPVYASKLGVDINNLLVSQPDNGEQALEIAETLVKSEQLDIIVVDSVAALVPKKELEGEMGDPQMGLQARLMSQALRKLTAVVSRTHTCLAFINQVREKIGGYGNPETTTGGRALKFYSSQRITVRPGKHITVGSKDIGQDSKVKFVKNKCAAPFTEAEVVMLYGQGFERVTNFLPPAVKMGIIERKGGNHYFNNERFADSEEAAIETLQMQPDLFASMWAAARERILNPPAAIQSAEPEADE